MSARCLILAISLFANFFGALAIWAQQSQPERFNVPIQRPTTGQADDQLPASRSFAPAAVNDLRNPNPSAAQSNNDVKIVSPKRTDGNQQPAQSLPTLGQFQARDNRKNDATRSVVEDNLGQTAPWSAANQLPVVEENSVPNQPNLPMLDESVRAIGYSGTNTNQLGNPNPQTTRGQTARQILARFEIASAADPIPGMPLRLQDALEQTPPQFRREMVKQYWTAFGMWADYLNCADHLQRMNRIPQPGNRVDQSLLANAQQSAETDLLEMEMRLAQAQTKLQSYLIGANADDLLPLPIDLPLVQRYDTHFDWYATNRQLPGSLKSIDLSLPKLLKLMSNRADAIWSAETAYDSALQAYANRQSALPTLLHSAETAKSNVTTFVRTTIEYNQSIADYSLTVTPTNQPAETVVAMLVAPVRAIELDSSEPMLREASRPRDPQLSPVNSADSNWPQTPPRDPVPTRVATGQPTFQQPNRGNSAIRGNELMPLSPNPSNALQPNSRGFQNSPAKQSTENQFNFGG